MLGVANVALRAAKPPKAAPALISHWELDETSSASGVFEDRGPASVSMIVAGVWADMTTGSLVEGVGGTSAYTDGSAYATIPADEAAHDLTELTISFYYQRNSATDKHILLAGGNGSEVGDFSIEVLANGRLRGWHTGQDEVLRFFESTNGVTGTNLQVGTAYRIDLSLGPQGARVYLDGAELPTAAIPGNTNGWNNGRVKYLGRWIDGVQARADGAFDRLRLWNRPLSSAEIADLEPAQSAALPLDEPGTAVDLGNADDKETTTHLSEGGSAVYNASGIVARIRWLGTQGCTSPDARSATTEQFLFRFTANHDGGRIFGGAVCGNLTPDDDYDPGDHGFKLYPCSDAGQIYVTNPGGGQGSIRDFTIEGWRFHSTWDAIRAPGGSAPPADITIKGCWGTCNRDDFIENDGGNQLFIRECLVGDTIGQNSGTWVFLSMTGGADHTDRTVEISDCLIWSHLMRATSRPRDVNGYACGAVFKINQGSCPRILLTNTVIMSDHLTISGGNGNPLHQITGSVLDPDSSGNLLIFRDLGNTGTSNIVLPPSFTLLTGSEGESEWNQRVAAWKAAHPNVRRLNKAGIQRPFGGTTSVVDQG